MEYQSTRSGTPSWVTSSGDSNCVTNPTAVEGSARDCFGKCLVDQEEFMVRLKFSSNPEKSFEIFSTMVKTIREQLIDGVPMAQAVQAQHANIPTV